MASPRKVLTVFLASPGDMASERESVKKIVDEWNAVNTQRENWFVELLGWEDTLPQAGRPQAIINEDVERCELFVGMMFRRWGSPPSGSDGPFSSGFEEEFTLAKELHGKEGRPQIAMLFRDPGPTDDAGPGLQKVLAFKAALREERQFLYKELRDETGAWSDELRCILHKLFFDQIARLERAALEATPAESTQQRAAPSPSIDRERSKLRIGIVQSIAAQFAAKDSDDDVSDVEVARLRLVALSIRRSALATVHLEAHDANLLYNHRKELKLSLFERIALMHSSLASTSAENIPLWGWADNESHVMESYLRRMVAANDDDVAVGALKVLTALNVALEADCHTQFHDNLVRTTSTAFREAACGYLQRTGSTADLPVLDGIAEQHQFGVGPAATAAAIHIRLREASATAAEQAITSVRNVPPGRARERLLTAVNRLGTAALALGTEHASPEIREASARELRTRSGLAEDVIERLKSDPSPLVRAQAVLALISNDQITSIESAERLVQPPLFERNALPFTTGAADTQKALAMVRRGVVEHMSDAELVTLASSADGDSPAAYEVMGFRRFESRASLIRRDLDDLFADHPVSQAAMTNLFRGVAGLASLLSRTATVPELVQSALSVLAHKGNGSDLSRIRRAITITLAKPTVAQIRYFRKFGDAGDLKLIDSALEPPPGIYLSTLDPVVRQEAGRTAYYLLGRSVAAALEADISPTLLGAILLAAEKVQLAKLTFNQRVALLSNKDLSVRKAAAIRIGASVTKGETRQLLDHLTSQPQYFYNAVYWLDCAQAIPRKWFLEIERALLELV